MSFIPILSEPLHTQPCPGCRAEVIAYPNGWGVLSYFRPTGTVLVKGETRIEERTAFLVHNCPDLVEWRNLAREEQERVQHARAVESRRRGSVEAKLRWNSNQEIREESILVAQRVTCPKCDAAIDSPCLNLVERKKGRETPTVWPHPERLAVATTPAPPSLDEQTGRDDWG